MGVQTFSFGIRRTAREALTEIGDRAGLMTLTQDLGEAFTHRPPTTSNGKCWNHVPRKEMVAVFDWQPRGDNQYFLPAKIKRYIDG